MWFHKSDSNFLCNHRFLFHASILWCIHVESHPGTEPMVCLWCLQNISPAMRHGKSRLIEMATTYVQESISTPDLVPGLLANITLPLGDTPVIQMEDTGKHPKLVLFQQLVLSIEKSNVMRMWINAYRQHCRIYPDKIEAVSDHEEEDLMPDITHFLGLPHSSWSAPHCIMAAGMSHLGQPTTLLPDPTPDPLPVTKPTLTEPGRAGLD